MTRDEQVRNLFVTLVAWRFVVRNGVKVGHGRYRMVQKHYAGTRN